MSAKKKVEGLKRIQRLSGLPMHEGSIARIVYPLMKDKTNLIGYWLVPLYQFYMGLGAGDDWQQALAETTCHREIVEEVYGRQWLAQENVAKFMDMLITLEQIGKFKLSILPLVDWSAEKEWEIGYMFQDWLKA